MAPAEVQRVTPLRALRFDPPRRCRPARLPRPCMRRPRARPISVARWMRRASLAIPPSSPISRRKALSASGYRRESERSAWCTGIGNHGGLRRLEVFALDEEAAATHSLSPELKQTKGTGVVPAADASSPAVATAGLRAAAAVASTVFHRARPIAGRSGQGRLSRRNRQAACRSCSSMAGSTSIQSA